MIDTMVKAILTQQDGLAILLYVTFLAKITLFLLPFRRKYNYHHLLYYGHASRVVSKRRTIKNAQNYLSSLLLLLALLKIIVVVVTANRL